MKVTGAHRSDQEGARALLSPLADRFPRMVLVWGDSHCGGHFVTWMKVNLGWRMQTGKRAHGPQRGILVSEGEEVDWDKRAPYGIPFPSQKMVIERTFSPAFALPSALSRSRGLAAIRSEAFIMLAASVRMFTRLAPQLPS